jgi:hypothetical protein
MTLAYGLLRTTGVPHGLCGRHDLPRDIVVAFRWDAMRPASRLAGSTPSAEPAAQLGRAER